MTDRILRLWRSAATAAALAAASGLAPTHRLFAEASGAARPLPADVVGRRPVRTASDTAVFAGGCFWGIEAVFEHLKGVTSAVSGYAGGSRPSPSYEEVSSGTTGHAEAVRVVYDPSKITYAQLLQVFFTVAHDPTQLNRQGPDAGSQYRSAVFYRNTGQERAARAYIAQLDRARAYPRPIVTQVVPLRAFYPAEDYHQDYMAHHPTSRYIVINDAPKVEHLRRTFPAWYKEP